jgi:hypothetical protein
MTDYGYMTVTAECPSCLVETDVRIIGNDGDEKYRTINCACGVTYAIKVVLTISGAVTEYTLT